MHPVYFHNDSTPEEESEHVESSAFMFYGSLFGPAIELSAEFACSNHNDMVAEPPLQIEGNSAIFNWFGDHTIIHDQSKYICKTCYLQLYKTYSQGSEKSSPQGYKITFEMLSQKIVSGNEESFIKYFGNKSAVNKKSLLTESDEAGLALLHYSVLVKDNSQITKYLIEEGASVDTKDHCGVSPLHWACWNADVDTIEILLDSQCNVFSRDVTGRLPLHYLCLSQNTKTKEQSMKLLSEYRGFSECSSVQDLAGCTPLHYATLSRSYPCVYLLLSHGSDPNCSATTSLSISTSSASLSLYSGDCRLVSLFKPRDKVLAALVGGGDVTNLKGDEGDDRDGLPFLHLAALLGRTDQVAKLLEYDNKDLPDTRTKRTPLIWAVVGDHPDTMYYLLKQGCDPTLTDTYGRRALCYVMSHGWDNILRGSRYLDTLTVFCSQYLKRNSIYSAIYHCSKQINSDEGEEDVSSSDVSGEELFSFGCQRYEDPLSIAVQTCDVKVVARLLLYGAGLNVTPCPLLSYPEDQSKEVFAWMLLMFIAVGYKFTDDDRTNIKAKLSGVERGLFTRYLEANSMCLEEIGDTIPISPLKMVLDRNDKRDFNDVVKVMMIGEVKAHSLPQDSIDINVRQVLHCVRKNCHTSNMTVSAVLEITNLLDGKTQKKGSGKLSQKIRSVTQSFTKLLRMKPTQVAILMFLFGLFSEFAIGIFMYYLDVISDVLLAVELYEKDSDLTSYTNQATQVLCFTFIPQGLIGIFLGIQYLKKRDMLNVIFSLLCFVGLGPVVVAFECVTTSIKWYNEGHILESHEDREKKKKKKQKQEKKPKLNPPNRFSPPEWPPVAPFELEWTHPLDKEQNPPNSGHDHHPKPLKDLLDEQIERWNAIRIWEASLESGPEILLQLYIAMCTNTYSILSIALSFFSLVQAAAEYYYCKASGAIGIPHLMILSTTTTLFLISRLLSAFSFIFKYGVVILFPLAVFFVTIVVDIAVNWKKVENKVLHVTTYLSSLFILVRSKFERNSSGQQILFYMLMIISNGLLVIPVVYPPTVGASRERCDLCHQRNCTYEISDLTNQSTLSSVTYNKDTLVYKLYGEDPLDSWEFTVVMPAIIVSSFVVGICGLVYYQHWLHPWRHIIATEPRFKTKDPADYSSKFLAGTLVAAVFAVGDLILLGGICLKSYPDDTLRGVLYFVFPYVVTAVAMVFFVIILTFSPMKISDNLKLKAIGRPNFILTGLINIYKISGIQGSILVGILKFYRDDLNDGMLDLYIGLYIACVLLGVLTTVWLYMDSSLKRKLQGRLRHHNTVSDIWKGAKNNVLSVDQRGLSLSRNRPRPPVFDHDVTPPSTPPALPDRKSSLDAGVGKFEPIKPRRSETPSPLPPPKHPQQNNDNNKQSPRIRPPPPPASHPPRAKKGPQLKNGNPSNSRKGTQGPPSKGPAPPKGGLSKMKDQPPSEPAQLTPMAGPGGHPGMRPRRQRPPPRR